MPSYTNSEEFKIDVRIEATAKCSCGPTCFDNTRQFVSVDDYSVERAARLRLQRILSKVWTEASRDGDVLAILHREFPPL